MTTLNIIRRGCPEAPELQQPPRAITLEVTTPEEARDALNRYRNLRCAAPNCDPDHLRATGTTPEKWTVPTPAPLFPAEPKPELWSKAGTIVQIDHDDRHSQTAILSRIGFTKTTAPRKAMKAAPSLTLSSAGTYIADHVTPDHTAHACPDCAEVMDPCTSLACDAAVSSYACHPCLAIRRQTADAAREANRHQWHACSECGEVTPSNAGTYSASDCTAPSDDPRHTSPYLSNCPRCSNRTDRYPVSLLIDRPTRHCTAPDCAVIVEIGTTRCRHHAETPATAPESPATPPEPAPAVYGDPGAELARQWREAYRAAGIFGPCADQQHIACAVIRHGTTDDRCQCPCHPERAARTCPKCHREPFTTPEEMRAHFNAMHVWTEPEPLPTVPTQPCACDLTTAIHAHESGRTPPCTGIPETAPRITSVTPTEDGGLAITFGPKPETPDVLTSAAAVVNAIPETSEPATTATAPHTCTTRAHTPAAWTKRGYTLRPDAQSHDREGWTLYCRHQVTETARP